MTVNDWKLPFDQQFLQYIQTLYTTREITPDYQNLFKAFELTSFEQVKVIFIGQDPYPTKGVATGLAFGVNQDVKLPASLRNLYKELETDLGIKRTDGNLQPIATQGVLFINMVLTCVVGEANSHQGIGWEEGILKVLADVCDQKDFVVFVLLGANAQKLKKKLDFKNHAVIEATHPSPLSAYRGFFGSKIFSRINNELKSNGKSEINWNQ